ncbi:hypothetical protein [Paenibacillus odorifer]|uniref:hypothetical protein n=1 Tax=Paenibacillus odorifer TaxID=189426 RepID=UPI00117BEF10|nr:hypothetical protein [Paenibacillus odorifer]
MRRLGLAKTAEQRFLFYWSIAALFFCLLAGWLVALALSACPHARLIQQFIHYRRGFRTQMTLFSTFQPLGHSFGLQRRYRFEKGAFMVFFMLIATMGSFSTPNVGKSRV